MLCYFLQPGEGPLQAELSKLQAARASRNEEMVRRLAAAGIPITLAEVEEESGGGSTGRPHIAAVLLAKGVVASLEEAFDRWIGEGRPAYVTASRLDPLAAARLAAESGAVVSLAHPLRLGLSPAALHSAIRELAEGGFAGIEVYHPSSDPTNTAMLAAMASEASLVATGGSDFHGTYKPDIRIGVGRGDLAVAPSAVEELAARLPIRPAQW